MNTSENTMLAIFGQSWNGTWFVYNTDRGEWENCDNVFTGPQHNATEADLDNAKAKAEREGATVLAENAHLDEVIISADL